MRRPPTPFGKERSIVRSRSTSSCQALDGRRHLHRSKARDALGSPPPQGRASSWARRRAGAALGNREGGGRRSFGTTKSNDSARSISLFLRRGRTAHSSGVTGPTELQAIAFASRRRTPCPHEGGQGAGGIGGPCPPERFSNPVRHRRCHSGIGAQRPTSPGAKRPASTPGAKRHAESTRREAPRIHGRRAAPQAKWTCTSLPETWTWTFSL